MNFEGIDGFAQEYLNQKHVVNYEISERIFQKIIKKMFKMILELNNKL